MHDNPLGLDGFEFVEFTSPHPHALAALFEAMGFTHLATHRSKSVRRYAQGDINLILNMEARGQVARFRARHGPSANAMAFRVHDAAAALAEAVRRGAKPVEGPVGPMELNIPAIKGIGGANLYLVDRYGAAEIYDVDFRPVPGVHRDSRSVGLHTLDHLTHNVNRGHLAHWADFYVRIFNFREIRYFDIAGQATGLISKAMTAPDGKIRIPLNEEGKAGGGQIEEFLRAYNGEGIQHIALLCDDLIAAWDRLKAMGVPLMAAPPATYYEMLDERLPGHGEPVGELQARGILLDGSTQDGDPRLLLQIFAQPQIGPVFFEFIQRKKDEGFGEGNFTALFQSIERDQLQRGALNVGEPA